MISQIGSIAISLAGGLIFSSFIGILIIFFDPALVDNFLGLFFASLMALFFGLVKVFQGN